MHTHKVTQISRKHLTRNNYSAHISTTRNTWGHRSQTSQRGTSVPEATTSTSFFMPGIFSCIWRTRVCLFAHCDCNRFRAYSVCVCSPHTVRVIAISFGRIVSVFVVRSNLTAPRLAAKRRVMEERESESELGSRDITNDIPSLAPSTEPSGASYNNNITHSPPALAGTLHHRENSNDPCAWCEQFVHTMGLGAHPL